MLISLSMTIVFAKSHRVDEIYDFEDFYKSMGGVQKHLKTFKHYTSLKKFFEKKFKASHV